ncbi:MAG: hypothetical protein F6K65_25540 [Moorea sp. SIO3C2]|nr:hypothetical protein [Moorena sp. SIO3C2]
MGRIVTGATGKMPVPQNSILITIQPRVRCPFYQDANYKATGKVLVGIAI